MKYRFVKEYGNYIKNRYNETDMPKRIKAGYIRQIDTITDRAAMGYITINECMKDLCNSEKWLNDYKLKQFI